MEKKFFTADEIISTFGLSRDQIESLVQEGQLKALADRGTFKYRRDEIEALIAGGLTPANPVSNSGNSDSDVVSFDFDGDFSAGPDAVSFLELDEDALATAPVKGNDSSSDVSIVDGGDDLMDFLSQLEDASAADEPTIADEPAAEPQPRYNSLTDLFNDEDVDETAGGTDLDLGDAAAQIQPTPVAETSSGFVQNLMTGSDDTSSVHGDEPALLDESGIGLDFPSEAAAMAANNLDFEDSNESEETGIRLELPEEAGTIIDDGSLALGMEDSGLSLDTGEQASDESGFILDASSDSSLRMSTADSGLSLDTGDSGLSLDTGDSGLSLDTGDSGLSLDVGDSGLSLDMGDSGLSLDLAADDAAPAPDTTGTQRMAVSSSADDDFDLSDELSLQDEESLVESSSTQRLAREEQFQEEDLFATQLQQDSADEVSEEDVTQMLILGEDDDVEPVTKGSGKAKGRKQGISDQFTLGEEVEDLELTDDLEDAVIDSFDDDDEIESLGGDDLVMEDDDEDAVLADDEDFSEEAMPTRGSARAESAAYALPSFGVPTTIALCLGGLFVVLNGWLVWEATATMWTGAEPSAAAASIINSLAGLIG